MDALELALTCSGLLMRTMHKVSCFPLPVYALQLSDAPKKEEAEPSSAALKDSDSLENMDLGDKRISETEAEKHFDGAWPIHPRSPSCQTEFLSCDSKMLTELPALPFFSVCVFEGGIVRHSEKPRLAFRGPI